MSRSGGSIGELATAQSLLFLTEGLNHYHESRMRETVERFGRARTAAAAARERGVEDEARFWEGAALHGMGRLQEALAVWAPALRSDVNRSMTTSRYMMITRYVLVAIDVPLQLDVIERAFEQVDEAVGSRSASGRRSRLLLARARLALMRGLPDEAFAAAQEALVRSRHEHPCYTLSTHYRGLVRAALLAHQPESVETAIAEWEAGEHAYPHAKRMGLAAARASLARYHGNSGEAVSYAALVAPEASRSEDLPPSVDASTSFVRACLAAGAPGRARPNLRHLLRYRNSEIGELRFDSRLLLADYHAASALVLADGQGYDPEFGAVRVIREAPLPGPAAGQVELELGPRSGRSATEAIGWHAARARRAYDAAGRSGRFLDEQLATDYRCGIIRRRLTVFDRPPLS